MKVLKSDFHWISFSILLWLLGWPGRDFYLIFLFGGLVLFYFNYIKNEKDLVCFFHHFKGKLIFSYWFLFFLIYTIKSILSLYSFKWNILDVGSYSISLFNASKGLNYNSFLNIPTLADHFIPSLFLVSPLYLIYPSVHWITTLKIISYFSTPLVLYIWIKEKSLDTREKLFILSAFGLFFIYSYGPSVSSLKFEFSPTSLSLPVILLAFIFLDKKKWFFLGITILFLLGFKENTGTVVIGFGLYQIFKGEFRPGFILFSFGLFSTYLIVFQLMPFLREYEDFGNHSINVFKDIDQKIYYLFKLLYPLGFIPLIFWKNGIIAAPAISVNLISGRETMYSSGYHYDDISSLLLILSCLISYVELRENNKIKLNNIYCKIIFLSFLLYLFSSISKSSPILDLYKTIPNNENMDMLGEIRLIQENYSNYSLALQNGLGPHFHREKIILMSDDHNGNCTPPFIFNKPADIIVLSTFLDSHTISNINECISHLDKNIKYQRISEFRHLVVFEKI